MNKDAAYRAYLLRLWAATEARGVTWRAQLEDPHTGEQLPFPSLAQLFDFLEQQTAALSRAVEQPPDRRHDVTRSET